MLTLQVAPWRGLDDHGSVMDRVVEFEGFLEERALMKLDIFKILLLGAVKDVSSTAHN